MAGKYIIAFACLSVLSPSSALVWDALKVTFSSQPVPSEGFWNLPLTTEKAKDAEWVQPEESKIEELIQTFCMKDDPRACILYDAQGNIAGYQLGITVKVDEVDMTVYPKDKGFTRATLFGQDMYINRMFFVPQEVIQAGGRSAANETGTGLWLNIKGQLTEIPRIESNLLSAVPGYVKQNCFMRMGQHYFFNASKSMQPEGYQPFFILYSSAGELQGLGMVMFGSNVEGLSLPGKRNWFEPLVSPVVRAISPDSPDWVLNTIDTVGVYSQHIYFVSNPETLACPAGKQAKGAY